MEPFRTFHGTLLLIIRTTTQTISHTGNLNRLFHQKEGYNPSHKRDDRTYDTNVEEEDVGKSVPTRLVDQFSKRLMMWLKFKYRCRLSDNDV